MDFYPVLENKRVLLRPLLLDDLALLKPIILAQPDLCSFMSVKIGKVADLEKFIHTGLTAREEEQSVPFLVYDKQYNRAAGSTRFGSLDIRNKRAEIGWTWIDESLHHTGLNKAMKYLMLQYAFETLDFNRVEIKTNEQNERSRKAIESIGGQYEGLFRHHMINDDGSLRNTVYYSILKEEWPAVKEQVFAKYLPDWY